MPHATLTPQNHLCRSLLQARHRRPLDVRSPGRRPGRPEGQARPPHGPRTSAGPHQLDHHHRHGPLPCRRHRRALLLLLEEPRGLRGDVLLRDQRRHWRGPITACSRTAASAPPSGSSTSSPPAETMALEGGPIFWVATHRVPPSELRPGRAIRTPPVDGTFWAPRRLDPLRPRHAL